MNCTEAIAEMDLDEISRAEAEELRKSLEDSDQEEDHHRRKRDEDDEQEVEEAAGKRQRIDADGRGAAGEGRRSHHVEEVDEVDQVATFVQVTASDGRVLNIRKRSTWKPKNSEVSLQLPFPVFL